VDGVGEGAAVLGTHACRARQATKPAPNARVLTFPLQHGGRRGSAAGYRRSVQYTFVR
jgi:hypothetical protein